MIIIIFFLENSRIISFWIGIYNSHLRLVYLYFRKKEGPRISPKRRLPLEWPVKIKRTDFLKNRSFVITVYLYTFGESFVVWTPCRTIVFLHLNLLQSESPYLKQWLILWFVDHNYKYHQHCWEYNNLYSPTNSSSRYILSKMSIIAILYQSGSHVRVTGRNLWATRNLRNGSRAYHGAMERKKWVGLLQRGRMQSCRIKFETAWKPIIGKSMDSSEQCSTSLNISEYAKVKLSSMRCGEFSDTSITAWRHGNRQIMKKSGSG